MTLLAAGRYSSKSEKIVLKVGTGTIEGCLESRAWTTTEELSGNAPDNSPEAERVGLHLGGLTPHPLLSFVPGVCKGSNPRLVTSAALT
jgi:hypothetical protein